MVNKACTTPWCHAVVHFEVKMSRFRAVFEDNRCNHGGKRSFFNGDFPCVTQ